MKRILLTGFMVILTTCSFSVFAERKPITIGEQFVLQSKILNEQRVMTSYVPLGYETQKLPVIYLLDGGVKEDFLHIAGLLQVGVGNGSIKPHRLIGIENTQRRRDLTGPTDDPRDKEIAPEVGGSEKFRQFIKSELIPFVESQFTVEQSRTLMGESLAGLFVLETLVLEPELFHRYIAVDPSVWWNNGQMVNNWPADHARYQNKTVYIATGSEAAASEPMQHLQTQLQKLPLFNQQIYFEVFANESHATVFHPAAMHGFRWMLKSD